MSEELFVKKKAIELELCLKILLTYIVLEFIEKLN